MADDINTIHIIDARWLNVRPSTRTPEEGAFDVFELIEGEEHRLTVADPWSHEPTEEELRSFLTPRKQRLVALMAEKDIEAGEDYDYAEDRERLEGTAPIGRYVSVYGDETYNQIHVTDSLRDALDCLGSIIHEQYCNVPEGVYDLDEDRMLRIKSTVTLAESEDAPADSVEDGPFLVPYQDVREALGLILGVTTSPEEVLASLDDAVSNNLGD